MFNDKRATILLNIRQPNTREWGWREMNNTLDRLKALNTKLEKKLSEKKKSSPGSSEDRAVTKADVLSEKRETAGKRPPQATVEKTETSLTATTVPGSTNRRILHRKLLSSLKIDAAAEPVRSENLSRLAELYLKLDIEKKVPNVEDIFIYKAMNISGIGLKEEDFGEIREGKYVQVIAITYEPDKNGKKKAKNISLGYFGKAETLEAGRKNEVIEFVLRWRYEKAFQNLEHYRTLLEKVRPKETLF